MERTGKTFIIVTNDGANNENVFLSWTTEAGGYYTTVDSIDEIGEYDFYDTVGQAIARAEDADSGTLGGWTWAPMTVVELLNFDEAYNNNAAPEFKEIVTITFFKN
jgi:hypothetical protein